MTQIAPKLEQAVTEGKLVASSRDNILLMLAKSTAAVVSSSIEELVAEGQWKELDDRFFRTLAFGTGGLRGRTIGNIVTRAERGVGGPLGRPEHPCTGTNAVNYFNMSRAVQGLVTYVKNWFAETGKSGRPALVFSHDTRHFSRDFAEFAASIVTGLGCDAYLFDGPRSTPHLSFAVRHVGASAGAMITASHNPPHDNGFKVYFSDGAQVVEPHAGGIIREVNAVEGDTFDPAPEPGVLTVLGADLDEAYMARLETLWLDPDLVRRENRLRIVFTPIHGTGGIIANPMLKRLGFDPLTVPEQDAPDARFPTVKSPNPENAEALQMALDLAEKEGADLVIGTDPDGDRMGVIARAADGTMKLLTGNQIGSLMAWYRVKTYLANGVLTAENKSRAVLVKTFVTTDLQKAIAEKEGLACVETLTGFKFIGEKLTKYENAIPAELRRDYPAMPEAGTRALRLTHSRFYVFGGEESYGYSGSDFVRDKDANGAVVMFAETATYAKSRGITLDQLLDEIFAAYGFYAEANHSMTFEGAEGAAKIARLAASYGEDPPSAADGAQVVATRDFSRDTILDSEGDKIPSERMLSVELADGRRFAVRPSGTEPKIKFYLFGHRSPGAGETFSAEHLAAIKPEVGASLASLWEWIQQDATQRLDIPPS